MTEYIAEMGKFVIGTNNDVLIGLAFGSCVGVVIFDKDKKIAGLAHVMLPNSTGVNIDNSNPDKYADLAIPNMLKELQKNGAVNFKSKIAGGAHMFKGVNNGTMEDIGRRNAESSREILKNLNIQLVSEDIGGEVGRTVRFFIEEGKYQIKTKEGIKEI